MPIGTRRKKTETAEDLVAWARQILERYAEDAG